jgi:hypothetical protein
MSSFFQRSPYMLLRGAGIAVCAIVALALVSGCSATTRVQETSLADLRKGVADTREQARLALTEANTLARTQAIARVLKLNKPALTEKDFVGAVSRDDIAKLDNAFALIDQYLNAIQYLTSPDRTAELENAAVGFGNQLATGGTNAALQPTVAAAFTQLGKAIVEAKANKEALAVMRRTDGDIRQALNAMALAIHDPSNNSGLRGTLMSNWAAAINGNDPATPLSRWLAALGANADEAAKRQIIDDFLAMVDARDAQLAALDRLRQSLGLLADAHTTAAQGRPADVGGIIAWIDRQLDETQATYGRFKEISDAHAARNATQPATQPVQ